MVSKQEYFLIKVCRLCLKFSLRNPYMMGLEQTELMAKKWNIVKKINIVS